MVFGPWDFQNSQKEVSGNFESMKTFALLIEIYLPCEFHKFPLSHSLETPKRGGVDLFEDTQPFLTLIQIKTLNIIFNSLNKKQTSLQVVTVVVAVVADAILKKINLK